jgi:MFS family permease
MHNDAPVQAKVCGAATGRCDVYQFCMWWYWGQAGLFMGRARARTRRGQMSSALMDGRWTGERAHEFWISIGQAWLSLAAQVAMIAGTVLLILRPGPDTFDAAVIAPALLFGFAGGGALAVTPAIYASWYRRHRSRPFAPARGSAGWWMLAVQIPVSVFLALILR